MHAAAAMTRDNGPKFTVLQRLYRNGFEIGTNKVSRDQQQRCSTRLSCLPYSLQYHSPPVPHHPYAPQCPPPTNNTTCAPPPATPPTTNATPLQCQLTDYDAVMVMDDDIIIDWPR